MKRLATILIICMMSVLLASCGMSRQEATEYVESMTKSNYHGFNSDLTQYVEQKNFQKAVSDVLDTGTPEICFRLFDNLNEYYDGKDESLRMYFQDYLTKLKEQVFSDTEGITFDEYVNLVCEYIGEYEFNWKSDNLVFVPVENGNYYATLEECLPYEQTAEYIKSHGEASIFENGHGGYYDDKQDDYEDTTKTVDPLGISEGKTGIGTMKKTQDYSFCGDFLVSEYREYWHGTSSDDKGNVNDVTLLYKDNVIFRDTSAKAYLNALKDMNAFMLPCYENDTIVDYFPCAIGDHKIVFTGAKGFLVLNYSE